jgi:pyruvate dehydrogenase E1 component
VLWLSSPHNANHERERRRPEGCDINVIRIDGDADDGAVFPRVRPRRVAVKPHASPVFHAIQYLLGNQTLDNLKNFRAFGGAQSYPSRTKDKDDVDFSTGSVGLGVAATGFQSLIQDYVHAKGWSKDWPKGRMVSLMGDAEIDEGNIHEALLEYWKHGLTNTWWVVDYNRQSLDSVVSASCS